MKKTTHRLCAVLLSAMLLVSLCALPALAEDGPPADFVPVVSAPAPEGGKVHLIENAAVTDSPYTPEGDWSFYLYAPTEHHDFDLMSGQLNAVIYLYPDKPYADEAEVLTALTELGLIDIAESAPAFIVVPNPLNGESYTEADLSVYTESNIYLAGGKIISFTPPTGEFARLTYHNLQYVIAEGDGATFVHNTLTQNANRIAGVLTFGGEMKADLAHGVALPAYLVNADETAVAYYKAVNGTDSEPAAGHFVNSGYTEKQVRVADGTDAFDAAAIADAWGTMLSRTTRAPMLNDVVANTMDMSEWVLMTWPNYDELGLTVTQTSYHYEGKDYVAYDYVPASYTGDKAVPLVVLLHGFSEDPLCPAATCGWADMAAENGFILVAPDYVNDIMSTGIATECVMAAVERAMKEYNIDTSRVYLTGFSMGGMNTIYASYAHTDVFAAIAPMAGFPMLGEFATLADEYDLPTFFLTGLSDDKNVTWDENGNVCVTAMGGNVAAQAAAFNGIKLAAEADFSINPWGYAADADTTLVHQDTNYYVSDLYAAGYTNPMVRLVGVENTAHACSNVYASLAWEYISRFARGEDGTVVELVQGTGDPTPEAPAPAAYTVKSGDSLWKIAKNLLGSGYKWSELYEANKDRIKDPNLIYAGQVLVLP